LRHEQERAHETVEAGVALHQQREAQADHVEGGDQRDDVDDRDPEAQPEQRIGGHSPIVVETDERIFAKATDRKKAEAQREQHRATDEDKEPDRVGQHKEIARYRFAGAIG